MHLFIIIMNDEAIASVRDSCCAITGIAFLFNEFASQATVHELLGWPCSADDEAMLFFCSAC